MSAASTQNQAMNALVFLYRKVLERPLDEVIDAVRAERKLSPPPRPSPSDGERVAEGRVRGFGGSQHEPTAWAGEGNAVCSPVALGARRPVL